jgi:surface carbohydrate biosynthesis protein
MNVYIVFELKQRELLSKLLLAMDSASKGNDVYLGRINSYIQRGFFNPGIVHLKSITPGNTRIKELEYLNREGFKITSQDEENGFIDRNSNYKSYRYSSRTISLIDKVFTWGPFDYNNLANFYSNYKSKFIKSGNPRVDFWRKDFEKFYKNIKYIGYENYILLSANFAFVCQHRTLREELNFYKTSGYFNRKGFTKNDVTMWYNDSFKIFKKYKKAIKNISKKFKNKIIIIRPHPVDSLKKWEKHFKTDRNIKIISKGFISDWIHKAKVVIHAGCTGGLEASLRNKNTISFYPIKSKHGHPFADLFSKKIIKEKKLLNHLEYIYSNLNSDFKFNNKSKSFIKKRTFNIFGDPSYKKISSTWQKIIKKNFKRNNLILLRFSFKIRDLRLKLLGKKIGDNKFSYFDKKEVFEIVSRLKKIDRKYNDIKIDYIKSDIIRVYK